jgi:hypothetical protein
MRKHGLATKSTVDTALRTGSDSTGRRGMRRKDPNPSKQMHFSLGPNYLLR